jgi:polar amino acid transport system substrate-binding protein
MSEAFPEVLPMAVSAVMRDDPAMGNVRACAAAIAVLATVSACAPTADNAATETRNCSKDELTTLYPGIFTVGTDQPAYPPWYVGDDPANGEGFESALAYAVAGHLGYGREEVRWVRVPFNGALEPGPKTYDANLSQFSITDQRRAAVDFSSPYFNVTQVVVTTETSPAANVRSMADLRKVQLGVQVGTTSHTAAIAIEGDVPVEVYNTNVDAKTALTNGEIDALVADLPTAFAVAGELRSGTIVGQLPPGADDVEQFGIVLDKDSSLTRCVSSVVDLLRADGTLRTLEREWLADAGTAPVLN